MKDLCAFTLNRFIHTVMLKINLLLLLVGMLSFPLKAQQPTQTLRGTVIDNASNIALPSANVIILDTKFGTQTDASGNFIIKNVTVGRYNIQVSMVGYEPILMKEIVLSSSKEVFLTVSMKESTTTLAEITVKPQVNKEQPLNSTATLSARMLSVEEARRYAGGFDDPARLVSSFAGVTSNVGNNAIVVRGNNPQALQWKLEGVEIPNPNHFADLSSFGGGGLTALSSQLLANSDFFSGAFPAEYNNALSGVFDIFMRKGNNNKAEHTFQVGLTGIDVSSEGPFKSEGKSSYLFNYRYSTMALLEPLLPDNAGGVKYQDFSFKLNFPTKKAGTFSFWGIGLLDNSSAKIKEDKAEWKYDTDKENQSVKQFMAASGISHKIFLNDTQYLKTTFASTINGIDLNTDRINDESHILPKNRINNQNISLVFNSYLNTKFSSKHTNKTGVVATSLRYDISLQNASTLAKPLEKVVEEKGKSFLLSAYTNSTINFSEKVTINVGANGQLFTLNNHYTIEPRLGIKYRFVESQALSVGYGLHSRLERLNYYFVKNGQENLNKNLDFTKAHHLVLGYDLNLSEFHHLKIEGYYQKLFNVPVIKDSSFSTINLTNDWFFKEALQNRGEGKNYGVDITFEKYLSDGFYYMVTGSIFSSRYRGGDGVWRNTRYNRNYAFNFLTGKEWQVGKSQQNVFGINIRLSYQGGDHYSPLDEKASQKAQEAKFDETQAFSKQLPSAFTSHFTASFKINKKKSSREIALKIINATMYKEFIGFQYNYLTKVVDEYREGLFIPNLSYRIEF